MRRTLLNVAVLLVVLAAGVGFGLMLRPAPAVQEIQGAVRYVPKEVIAGREPDAKVGTIESVVKPAVKPDYIAQAPGAAFLDVEDFWALPRAIERGDTTDLPERKLLVRSVRTKDGFLFGKDQITTVSVLSDGTLDERRFSAFGGWQFRADGDSIVFQHPRFPVKAVAEVAVVAGAVILLCNLIGGVC